MTRMRYRPDADASGEAVVGLDVFVQLSDSPPSQRGAVVGFVDVQHHCERRGAESQSRRERFTPQSLGKSPGTAPLALG